MKEMKDNFVVICRLEKGRPLDSFIAIKYEGKLLVLCVASDPDDCWIEPYEILGWFPLPEIPCK